MTTLTLRSATSSPYAVLAAELGALPAPQKKKSLLTMSRLAEARTASAPIGAVVLAVLQEDKHYTAQTERRYRNLADRGVVVVLFAHGWTGLTRPAPGLHLVGLAADDAARDEWDLLICTPRQRSGFVSLDTHGDAMTEMDRVFAWLTTRDGDSIGRAANALLTRVPTLPVQVPPLG